MENFQVPAILQRFLLGYIYSFESRSRTYYNDIIGKYNRMLLNLPAPNFNRLVSKKRNMAALGKSYGQRDATGEDEVARFMKEFGGDDEDDNDEQQQVVLSRIGEAIGNMKGARKGKEKGGSLYVPLLERQKQLEERLPAQKRRKGNDGRASTAAAAEGDENGLAGSDDEEAVRAAQAAATAAAAAAALEDERKRRNVSLLDQVKMLLIRMHPPPPPLPLPLPPSHTPQRPRTAYM